MRRKVTPVQLIKSGLSAAGAQNCASLISAGSVDKSTEWKFEEPDEDKLLNTDAKNNWKGYAKWFLSENPSVPFEAKGHFKHAFGKNGKVYRSALLEIRSHAARDNDTVLFNAAGAHIDEIDGTKNYSGQKSLSMHQKAWAKFDIEEKGIQETDTHYIFKGIATTPTPDRMADIVEPMGAEFELPLPFLYQHDSDRPIGNVTQAKPNKSGIPVTFQIPKVSEPGTLKDRIDQAIQEIKYLLVKGLSIGFAPIEYSYMEDTGGYRFIKWLWLELSAVTIPANGEASILSIKSYDEKAQAAFRKKSFRVVSVPALRRSVKTSKAAKHAKSFRVVSLTKR